MTKFTYDDIVRVSLHAPCQDRRGQRGWVIAVKTEDKRKGEYFEQFPAGTIYLIEFEDGEAIDVHEADLELEEEPPNQMAKEQCN